MSAVSKIDRRARAYQCLRCLHKRGETFIGAQFRVMDHFLKRHLAEDEVPHHCTLCLFRCFKREELEAHVTSFVRHQLRLAEKGVDHSPTMLVSNKVPYVIGDKDIVALTVEESQQHWSKVSRGAQKTITDPLAEAVKLTFPDGLQTATESKLQHHTSPQAFIPNQSVPCSPLNTPVLSPRPYDVSNLSPFQPLNQQMSLPEFSVPVVSTVPYAQATNTCNSNFPMYTMQPQANPLITQLQQLLGIIPSAVPMMQDFQTHLPHLANRQIGQTVATPQSSSLQVGQPVLTGTPTVRHATEQPVAITLVEEDKDILQDLLPLEAASPIREVPIVLAPTKRPRSRSPSVCSSSSSSSSSASSAAALQQRVMLRSLQTAVEENTAAIRAQEKAMKDLATVVLSMSQAICDTTSPTRRQDETWTRPTSQTRTTPVEQDNETKKRKGNEKEHRQEQSRWRDNRQRYRERRDRGSHDRRRVALKENRNPNV